MALGLAIQLSGVDSAHWLKSFLIGNVIDAGGQIFIRSLQLLVVPLVLVSLICGAASLGQAGNMGRVAGKSVGLYLLTTAIAISMALVLAMVLQPGVGVSPAEMESTFVAKEPQPIKDTLINVFPINPVAAMAEGNMLQIIVFALLLGVALAKAGAPGERITAVFQDLNEVLMKLITMLIKLAPLGVFCLMARLFTIVGWEQIAKLLLYFLTVVIALVAHAALVYPTLLTLLGRVNPIRFFTKMREPMLVAFSTSSSGATLPVTLRTVEQRIGREERSGRLCSPAWCDHQHGRYCDYARGSHGLHCPALRH